MRTTKSCISNAELQKLVTDGNSGVERTIRTLRGFFHKLTNNGEKYNVAVEVKMLKTQWIFRDRKRGLADSFDYFIKALAK